MTSGRQRSRAKNTVRDVQNATFTNQQFLKIRDMIRSGDTTDKQRVLNAIAITSSQRARTHDYTIKALETEVINLTAMMGQKTEASKDHGKQKCILPQSVQW